MFRSSSLNREIANINKKLAGYQPRFATLDVLEKNFKEKERKKLIIQSYGEKKSKLPKILKELEALALPGININVINLTPGELHIWGTVFAGGGFGRRGPGPFCPGAGPLR